MKCVMKCVLCDKPIEAGHSPFSICYDPEWEHNVWGGDTHESLGLLCVQCGEKIAPETFAAIQKEISDSLAPRRLLSVEEIMSQLDQPSPLGSDREIATLLLKKGVRPMMSADECCEVIFPRGTQ